MARGTQRPADIVVLNEHRPLWEGFGALLRRT